MTKQKLTGQTTKYRSSKQSKSLMIRWLSLLKMMHILRLTKIDM